MKNAHPATSLITRRRGLFLTDMIVGLILVVALTAVLGAMVWRTNLIEKKLADNRAALRLAERALADLRAGSAIDASNVRVRRLTDGTAGQMWVEVTASVDGRSVALVGLVRKEAAP